MFEFINSLTLLELLFFIPTALYILIGIIALLCLTFNAFQERFKERALCDLKYFEDKWFYDLIIGSFILTIIFIALRIMREFEVFEVYC